MNNQEFFDEAASYLLSMKKKSTNDGFCSYLTEDGNKCVIGHFIPDGHPGQKCFVNVRNLVYSYPELKGIVCPDTEDGEFLAEIMQNVHDHHDSWDENGFIEFDELREIAEDFNLDTTKLEELIEGKTK